MTPVISRASKNEADDFPRTDWFSPDQTPSIPGEYEARTGGGHVFRRRWDGAHWRNSITGLVSTAPIDWRGIEPGSVQLKLYPLVVQHELTNLPSA